MKFTYDVTLRRVRVTIDAVENECLTYNEYVSTFVI
jgi:hypothetical protein